LEPIAERRELDATRTPAGPLAEGLAITSNHGAEVEAPGDEFVQPDENAADDNSAEPSRHLAHHHPNRWKSAQSVDKR